jgi:hypothetical protein
MNATDGFTEKFSNGDAGEVGEPSGVWHGAGVCNNDAIDLGFFESFGSGAAEDGVCGSEKDPASTVCADDFDSAADGTGGGDHIIEDESGFAFDWPADEICLTGFHGICATFIDDGK